MIWLSSVELKLNQKWQKLGCDQTLRVLKSFVRWFLSKNAPQGGISIDNAMCVYIQTLYVYVKFVIFAKLLQMLVQNVGL